MTSPVGYSLGPSGVALTLATYTAAIPGEVIPIAGAGTYSVDLAMMPATGLIALAVEALARDPNSNALLPTAAVVVRLTVNGTTRDVPITPGGFLAQYNPATDATTGITALQLITTAAAVCRVTAYG